MSASDVIAKVGAVLSLSQKWINVRQVNAMDTFIFGSNSRILEKFLAINPFRFQKNTLFYSKSCLLFPAGQQSDFNTHFF